MTHLPTLTPTSQPTPLPTLVPSPAPSTVPTFAPTPAPTLLPSVVLFGEISAETVTSVATATAAAIGATVSASVGASVSGSVAGSTASSLGASSAGSGAGSVGGVGGGGGGAGGGGGSGGSSSSQGGGDPLALVFVVQGVAVTGGLSSMPDTYSDRFCQSFTPFTLQMGVPRSASDEALDDEAAGTDRRFLAASSSGGDTASVRKLQGNLFWSAIVLSGVALLHGVVVLLATHVLSYRVPDSFQPPHLEVKLVLLLAMGALDSSLACIADANAAPLWRFVAVVLVVSCLAFALWFWACSQSFLAQAEWVPHSTVVRRRPCTPLSADVTTLVQKMRAQGGYMAEHSLARNGYLTEPEAVEVALQLGLSVQEGRKAFQACGLPLNASFNGNDGIGDDDDDDEEDVVNPLKSASTSTVLALLSSSSSNTKVNVKRFEEDGAGRGVVPIAKFSHALAYPEVEDDDSLQAVGSGEIKRKKKKKKTRVVPRVPFASATLMEGCVALVASAPNGRKGGEWKCPDSTDNPYGGGSNDAHEVQDPCGLVCRPQSFNPFCSSTGSSSSSFPSGRSSSNSQGKWTPSLSGRHFVGFSPGFVGFYAINLGRQFAYVCAVQLLVAYPQEQAAATLGVEFLALAASVLRGPYTELAGINFEYHRPLPFSILLQI